MKTLLSFPRAALTAVALGSLALTTLRADDATTTSTTTTTPTCTAGGHHHHGGALTEAERAQLKKAHEAALAADPTLQTDETALKQQFANLKSQGASASASDRKALHEQGKALHEKMRAAELKIDPTLAPIFAKLDAAHGEHHHHST